MFAAALQILRFVTESSSLCVYDTLRELQPMGRSNVGEGTSSDQSRLTMLRTAVSWRFEDLIQQRDNANRGRHKTRQKFYAKLSSIIWFHFKQLKHKQICVYKFHL